MINFGNLTMEEVVLEMKRYVNWQCGEPLTWGIPRIPKTFIDSLIRSIDLKLIDMPHENFRLHNVSRCKLMLESGTSECVIPTDELRVIFKYVADLPWPLPEEHRGSRKTDK